jgi:hypothetical protein
MSHILTGLGLTRDQVRALTGNTAAPLPTTEIETRPELSGHRYKAARKRLVIYERWVVAQYITGVHVDTIAASVGVTAEAIRKRLRALALFESGGKPGRPKLKERFQ